MSQSSSKSSSSKRPKQKPGANSTGKQQLTSPGATRPGSPQTPTTKSPTSSGGKAGSRPSTQSPTGRRREPPHQQRETPNQRAQRQRPKRKGQRGSNRGLWLAIGGTIAAVVAVIVLFIVLGHNTTRTPGGYPVTAADPNVVKRVTTVSPSVLASVGSGQTTTRPTKLNGAPPLNGPTGKPEVLYYGAEYCPFCAAERWSLIVALSRFGAFSNLHQTTSSPTDVYPNTHTFTFHGSSYTSQYIDFVPLEVQSYPGVPLETPTAAQQQLINRYNPNGSFPFINIANKYTLTGASYDPQVLSNLSWQQIASALSNPQSPVAQSILGSANYFTAAICSATNQQPASVCQAAPIPQVQQSLNGSTGNTGTPGALLFAPAAVFRSPPLGG